MGVPQKRKLNEVDHSAAEKVSALHYQGKKKASKAFKKFEKKVLQVVNEETPTGRFRHTTTIFAPITNANLCNIISTDMGDMAGTAATENSLEFFSPRMFKDAEAILFNAKSITYNSWISTNTTVPLTSGVNFPSANVTKVNSSSASFHFKNHSQRQLTLEMYICYGKGSGGNPRADLQSAFAANGNFGVIGPGGTSSEFFRNYGTSLSNVPAFMDKWDVRKVSWEFEPGEEAWHILKGPHAYLMDGAKKNSGNSLTVPNWSLPNEAGCGCYVFFRLGTDISLYTTDTGSKAHISLDNGSWSRNNNVSVVRAPDVYSVGTAAATAAGGMAIIIQRNYNIEMPEGTLGSIPTNAILLYNGFGSLGVNNLETNMEEDQPSTVPTIPK